MTDRDLALRRCYRQRAAVFLQSLAPSSESPSSGGVRVGTLDLSALGEAGRSLALRALRDTRAVDSDARTALPRGGGIPEETAGGRIVGAVALPLAAGGPEAAGAVVETLAASAAAGPAYADEDCTCACCGAILLPGRTSTVRLRRVGRGRTRRRRAGRCRAKRAVREEQMTKYRSGGRLFSPPFSGSRGDAVAGAEGTGRGEAAASSVQEVEWRRRNRSIRRVTDGMCGHCVVYRCDFCGTSKKFAGIEVTARERRRQLEKERFGPNLKTGAPKGEKVDRAKRKRQEKGELRTTGPRKKTPEDMKERGEGLDEIGGDFIALGAAPAPFSPKPTGVRFGKAGVVTPRYAPPGPGVKRLDQGQKKKKKQKQKQGKKSKLMDFLSSLND